MLWTFQDSSVTPIEKERKNSERSLKLYERLSLDSRSNHVQTFTSLPTRFEFIYLLWNFSKCPLEFGLLAASRYAHMSVNTGLVYPKISVFSWNECQVVENRCSLRSWHCWQGVFFRRVKYGVNSSLLV